VNEHRFAKTPEPPYYAVIFTMQRSSDDAGYQETAASMFKLAKEQPGCLGIESATGTDGFGMTIAYFRDEASIRAWREHPSHVAAQHLGKSRWYERYRLRIALVGRTYAGPDRH
jgi:heme-degrading monooxygenase HmoA